MESTTITEMRRNKLAILLHDGVPPREAVIQAGYKGNRNWKNILRSKGVVSALKKLQSAQAMACLITRDRVLAGHAEIAFENKEATIADRQRSLDAISRMCGMDAPKKMEIGRAGEFSSLSDEELDEKIRALHGAVIEAKSRIVD